MYRSIGSHSQTHTMQIIIQVHTLVLLVQMHLSVVKTYKLHVHARRAQTTMHDVQYNKD